VHQQADVLDGSGEMQAGDDGLRFGAVLVGVVARGDADRVVAVQEGLDRGHQPIRHHPVTVRGAG
jgi:hypothetical protein